MTGSCKESAGMMLDSLLNAGITFNSGCYDIFSEQIDRQVIFECGTTIRSINIYKALRRPRAGVLLEAAYDALSSL